MKIEIWLLTKLPKGWWGETQIKEYLKRFKTRWKVEIREFKKEPEIPDNFILLDEGGKELTSMEFSKLLKEEEAKGNDIIFVIGGPFGVNKQWKERAKEIISLSKMTLQHQIALILLVEQIYRGFTIISGHPYHH